MTQHPPPTKLVHVPAPTKGQVSSLLRIPPHSLLEGLGPYDGCLFLSVSLVLPFLFITSFSQQTRFVIFSFTTLFLSHIPLHIPLQIPAPLSAPLSPASPLHSP